MASEEEDCRAIQGRQKVHPSDSSEASKSADKGKKASVPSPHLQRTCARRQSSCRCRRGTSWQKTSATCTSSATTCACLRTRDDHWALLRQCSFFRGPCSMLLFHLQQQPPVRHLGDHEHLELRTTSNCRSVGMHQCYSSVTKRCASLQRMLSMQAPGYVLVAASSSGPPKSAVEAWTQKDWQTQGVSCSRPVEVAVPVWLVAGIDARLGLGHELRIHGGGRDQWRAGLGQEHKTLIERVLQR